MNTSANMLMLLELSKSIDESFKFESVTSKMMLRFPQLKRNRMNELGASLRCRQEPKPTSIKNEAFSIPPDGWRGEVLAELCTALTDWSLPMNFVSRKTRFHSRYYLLYSLMISKFITNNCLSINESKWRKCIFYLLFMLSGSINFMKECWLGGFRAEVRYNMPLKPIWPTSVGWQDSQAQQCFEAAFRVGV